MSPVARACVIVTMAARLIFVILAGRIARYNPPLADTPPNPLLP